MHQHLAGVTTEISDSTITVTDKEGNTFTVDLPQGLTGFEVGQFVTLIISKRAPGEGNPMARAAYRFDEVAAKAQLEEAEASFAIEQ